MTYNPYVMLFAATLIFAFTACTSNAMIDGYTEAYEVSMQRTDAPAEVPVAIVTPVPEEAEMEWLPEVTVEAIFEEAEFEYRHLIE